MWLQGKSVIHRICPVVRKSTTHESGKHIDVMFVRGNELLTIYLS